MTHLPLSVVSCPSLTCRPSESHCQASLRTLWSSSLRSKCAGEDRARDSRRLWNLFGHSRSRVTDRLADQLVRGINPLPPYAYCLLFVLSLRKNLPGFGSVYSRCSAQACIYREGARHLQDCPRKRKIGHEEHSDCRPAHAVALASRSDGALG